MTRRWVTAIVYAAAALAMAERLECYREFGLDAALSPSAKVAVAGCVILGVASLLVLFELRYGVVLGLVGECLCWQYFGALAFYFPWRNVAGELYQIGGWPEVMGIFGLVAATLLSLFPLRGARTSGRSLKCLRIILPAVQVVLVVTFYALKFSHALPWEGYRLQRLILEVNFLVMAVWIAIGVTLEWLTRFLPSLSGWREVAVETVLVTLFLSSLALFWYFVGAEIEMRRQGKSRLRLTGNLKELLAISALFLLGAGALFGAHNIPLDWIMHWRTRTTPLEVAISYGDLYFRRLILIVWGLIFLRLAIHDLIILLRSRSSNRLNLEFDK
jgi:hypothetical protein